VPNGTDGTGVDYPRHRNGVGAFGGLSTHINIVQEMFKRCEYIVGQCVIRPIFCGCLEAEEHGHSSVVDGAL